MPRIRFTADPKLPRDLAHLGYRAGVEVDLSADQADRWLRRGVAVIVEPPAAPVLQLDQAPADGVLDIASTAPPVRRARARSA